MRAIKIDLFFLLTWVRYDVKNSLGMFDPHTILSIHINTILHQLWVWNWETVSSVWASSSKELLIEIPKPCLSQESSPMSSRSNFMLRQKQTTTGPGIACVASNACSEWLGHEASTQLAKQSPWCLCRCWLGSCLWFTAMQLWCAISFNSSNANAPMTSRHISSGAGTTNFSVLMMQMKHPGIVPVYQGLVEPFCCSLAAKCCAGRLGTFDWCSDAMKRWYDMDTWHFCDTTVIRKKVSAGWYSMSILVHKLVRGVTCKPGASLLFPRKGPPLTDWKGQIGEFNQLNHAR